MPSRREWTDRLLSLIDAGLEKDGNLDMRKLVAQFSLDNYKSPKTVKEFIYTLRDAGRIYIEKSANLDTIFRSKEEAERQGRVLTQSFLDSMKRNSSEIKS